MRQEVFEFFFEEHDIILLESQWSDIVNLVDSEVITENKAQGETITKLDCTLSLAFDKIESLEESRDELLENLKDARLLIYNLINHEKTFSETIQKTQALKEKNG